MADGHFGGLVITCYALSLRSVERNQAEQASTKPPKWTRGNICGRSATLMALGLGPRANLCQIIIRVYITIGCRPEMSLLHLLAGHDVFTNRCLPFSPV